MLTLSSGLRRIASKSSASRGRSRSYSSPSRPPWRVLFFGTGDVALSSVKLLHSRKDLISKLAIVSPPQKNSKVPLPTREWATSAGVSIVNWFPKPAASSASTDTSEELTQHKQSIEKITRLAHDEFDIGVVVDFGYMISSNLIESFPTTPILMHPSLLPKYRGAAPIEHAIMSGDSETGVTVLDVAPSKFDAGKIILQRPYSLDSREAGSIIRQKLADFGAQAVVDVLERYEELKETKIAQNPEGTKAPKLKPSDYLVNWSSQKPLQIYNQWRALGPLTTHLHGCKHMKSKNEDGTIMTLIHELCHPEDCQVPPGLPVDASPGSVAFDKPNNLLWTKCSSENDWLAVRSIQLDSGRRILDATSFVNGIQLKANKSQYLESVGL